jgi:hypothetical protein
MSRNTAFGVSRSWKDAESIRSRDELLQAELKQIDASLRQRREVALTPDRLQRVAMQMGNDLDSLSDDQLVKLFREFDVRLVLGRGEPL